MKIWLDDIRTKPSDYDYWARTSSEVISLLQHEDSVTEIDLDYDLADGDCGAKVLEFIEYMEYTSKGFFDVIIKIHSANPEGVKRMNLIIDSIERIRRDKIRRRLNNAY